MKRSILISLIIILCLLLSGCDPSHFNYKLSDFADNVTNVEIVYYDNSKAKVVADHFGQAKHLDFDFDKLEVIDTLEEKDADTLFTTISDQLILNHVNHFNSPNGECFKVNYDDGSFDIISTSYIGRFNKEGEFIKFFGIIDATKTRALITEIFGIDFIN